MTFRNNQKFGGLLLLLTTTFSVACNIAPSNSGKVSEVPVQVQEPKESPPPYREPVTAMETDRYTPELRETWKRFTADGRYRLAQDSDMRFPDPEKEIQRQHIPANPVPYVYVPGSLNYDKRVDDDHLAAIVVDTTGQDNGRFSLVIFSPPKSKKIVFETHWIFRDSDLSKVTIGRASGDLSVREHLQNGSQKSCFARWNRATKQFECNLSFVDTNSN
jgi:hypothetical protein